LNETNKTRESVTRIDPISHMTEISTTTCTPTNMNDGSLEHLSPLTRISNTGYLLAINELSFGALRKAQRTLDRTHIDSDDGEESDESDSTEGQRLNDDSDEQSRAKVDSAAKGSKRDAATAARKNKHA
jgi:hypothetical protein